MPRSTRPSLLPWYTGLALLAALCAMPLWRAGASCGHDFVFHLTSWLNAAQEFRHGALYPSWASAAAYNAGEPRFLFYPPLSWALGALLTLTAPFAHVPALFTTLGLLAAGGSFFAVARRFVSDHAAFLAAALYLANPYMLFTAFERTAYGELLAAVWAPWLIGAILAPKLRAAAIAWPLALLWLSNDPAAVMASYAVALLAAVRLLQQKLAHQPLVPLLRSVLGGTALGLTLPAFYLFPVLWQRHFVEIDMVLTPGLSIPSNFLFAHTPDAAHDRVNAQVSVLALGLLAVTLLALAAAAWQNTRANSSTSSSGATQRRLLAPLLVMTVTIAFLFEPLSLPLWMHLPELRFLQFTWRLLMLLAVIAALACALLAQRLRPRLALLLAPVAVLGLSLFPATGYISACPADESPATLERNFQTSHGTLPTDEYTPQGADNDYLRFDDPGYWLATNPAAFAPGTEANPNAEHPDLDFGEPAPAKTLSHPAPHHLELELRAPATLVLNLREYPEWKVLRNGLPLTERTQRDDGLLALPLPAGRSVIDIRWRSGWDRRLGAIVSLLALSLLLVLLLRSRRIKAESCPSMSNPC
ncbi:MAG: hypothetical protein PW735_05130 [Acidobacteriaceae bacterium]|nr:hypothetical protein [Acidobacteriaceae bacterium]